MQALLLKRYIWLVNTIASAGHITKEELDRRWSRSSVNDQGETDYNRRSLLRHREEIESLFGIRIALNRSGNTYYIENREDINSDDMRQWLMNNFAVNNALNESQQLRQRILVEHIPGGTQHLPTILEAMRNNHVLRLTHQRFGLEEHEFTLEPYCLRVFKQRWYVYGRPSDHPNERRIYALDRIGRVEETQSTFRMPRGFDAEAEFATYYGAFTDRPAETVRVRVVKKGAYFMRTLPLHQSQREVGPSQPPLKGGEEWTEFEFYISPTFDFIQQLRTYGSQLEVLSPQWLREEMKQEVQQTAALYS